MTDRVNLQEGTQKARLLILHKVKVSVIEVRKAKDSNGKKKKSLQSLLEKRRKKENPWTREPKTINNKSQLFRLRRHSLHIQYWQLNDFHTDNTNAVSLQSIITSTIHLLYNF